MSSEPFIFFNQAQTQKPGQISTMAVGEEGGAAITQALNETGLGQDQTIATTFALGEEGGQSPATIQTMEAFQVLQEADKGPNMFGMARNGGDGQVSLQELSQHQQTLSKRLDLVNLVKKYFPFFPQLDQFAQRLQRQVEVTGFLTQHFAKIAEKDGNNTAINAIDLIQTAQSDGNVRDISQVDINNGATSLPGTPGAPPEALVFQRTDVNALLISLGIGTAAGQDPEKQKETLQKFINGEATKGVERSVENMDIAMFLLENFDLLAQTDGKKGLAPRDINKRALLDEQYATISEFDLKLSRTMPRAPKGLLSPGEAQRIQDWMATNNRNLYGDPKGTNYKGKNPLKNEKGGYELNIYHYIIKNHPDRPWNSGMTKPEGTVNNTLR